MWRGGATQGRGLFNERFDWTLRGALLFLFSFVSLKLAPSDVVEKFKEVRNE